MKTKELTQKGKNILLVFIINFFFVLLFIIFAALFLAKITLHLNPSFSIKCYRHDAGMCHKQLKTAHRLEYQAVWLIFFLLFFPLYFSIHFRTYMSVCIYIYIYIYIFFFFLCMFIKLEMYTHKYLQIYVIDI